MMNYSDAHAHLNFPDFNNDRDDVIKRASNSGCALIINIGAGRGIEGNYESIKLTEKYSFIYTTAGIHPNDVVQTKDLKQTFLKCIRSKSFVAIGEIGLDFYRLRSTKERQKALFREQLKIAKDQGFPVVIHSRNAMKETLDIIESEDVWGCNVIFHCFSGDKKDAEYIIKKGGYISFAGNITYKSNGVYNELLQTIPDTRLIIETDCPYLSPVPMRGKRNEPSFITYTAEYVAKLKGLNKIDILRITLLNTHLSFKIKTRFEPKIAYKIRDSLYLNITNRCTNDCTFCGKRKSWFVKGHYLKLEKEPSLEDIIKAIDVEDSYSELVFCGYGEPLLRLDVVKEVARLVKAKKNVKIRIDTDGLASAVYKKNIPFELAGLIDSISISLNAPSAFIYTKLCPSKYGESAFHSVLKFITDAKRYIPEVITTAVELPGLSIEDVRNLADSLGVKFRARKYDDLG